MKSNFLIFQSVLLCFVLVSCVKDPVPFSPNNFYVPTILKFTIQSSATHYHEFTLKGDDDITGNVDWGNGTITPFTGNKIVTQKYLYPAPGTYTVKISITSDEQSITDLIFAISEITSVSGLEALVQLQSINMHHNLLKTINLRENSFLREIVLHNNELTDLDITQNINLIQLFIPWNHLTLLNLSNNDGLELLGISNNDLTRIDISRNKQLRIISIEDNKLPTSVIDQCLIDADQAGKLQGRFSSFDQLPAAAPSIPGQSAKQHLLNKNWVITTD